MRYGLIGESLGHSFSKELHERLGLYAYELIELAPAELGPFLERRDFGGLNVTIPYKQAVIPYLEELSPRAAAIGAVNTVVNRSGKLYGDNTDLGGMLALLRRVGAPGGKKVLILGTGGTSRTALAAAEELGASQALRVSRTGRDGAITYEEAYARHADAAVLINTSPCGMYPRCEARPIDPARFPALEAVADAVYNPLRSRLVQSARALGVPAEGGLYMLTAQAVLAAEQFAERRFSPETVDRLYREIRREKENLVLIGMPGSGKSTLGRLLAARTGKPFCDTDARIVERTGKPITAIFAEDGEAAFRDLETEVLRDCCARGGAVLATGGGAVLRAENRALLRQNGPVILLDRPLEDLSPTGDRPLGDSMEKLRRLWAERKDIYRAAADLRISVAGTPEETAARIITEWEAMA